MNVFKGAIEAGSRPSKGKHPHPCPSGRADLVRPQFGKQDFITA